MRISGSFRSRCVFLLALVFLGATTVLANSALYNFGLVRLDGRPGPLSFYQGRVLLIVNVASQCGYNAQYANLEALYGKYKDRGLTVIAFPTNDFSSQEAGATDDCTRKYTVTFPMYSKIWVKGLNEAPIYKYLVNEDPTHSGDIKANFTKFLVDREGKIVGRFEPTVTPDDPQLTSAIEKYLQQKTSM